MALVEIWYKVVWLFAAIDLLLRAMFKGFLPMRISAERAEKLAWRSPKGRHFGSQPDALGVATRLAAGRLREAGIVLEPLLRGAGLSLSQINKKDVRIGVASQIMFLELAAQALKDPLLGFRLARDGDLRQMGLLYYAAASSETLGEALGRAQRYSSIVNAGVVLNCFQAGNFTIALRYFGVARHSDRQQMELLVTTLIRVCRTLTGRSLKPTVVRLVHRRSGGSSELEKFFGCSIEFGADHLRQESSATSSRRRGSVSQRDPAPPL
jgi:Arabinose-binding domain of AraC transcription regulator, N-term